MAGHSGREASQRVGNLSSLEAEKPSRQRSSLTAHEPMAVPRAQTRWRPLEFDGSTWPTSEHHYQAQKFTDPALRARVRGAATPRDAQRVGGQLSPVRPGFHQTKLDVMRTVLQAKFTQHDELREKLLGSGDAVLIEASPIDDSWGEGQDETGQNWLGRLLIEVRSLLRADTTG